MMAGTTSKIALLLKGGSLTLAECARMLGMSRAHLDERLCMMERQGYLVRAAPQKDGGCTCSGCCATCSCCGAKDTGAVPVLYSLTGKGERLAAGR
jgi:DNA-binding HxlR family transcriptional regulator